MKSFVDRIEELRNEAVESIIDSIKPHNRVSVERFGIEEEELGIITYINSDYSFNVQGDSFPYHIKKCSTETLCVIADELNLNN